MPGAPTALSATHDGTTSHLAWATPANHGSAIIAYEVVIADSMGNYLPSPSCQAISTALSCNIAYTELIGSFGLVLADKVLFKVRAKNAFGWSAYSVVNTGTDVVKTEPLAPPTKIAEGLLTDDSQV